MSIFMLHTKKTNKNKLFFAQVLKSMFLGTWAYRIVIKCHIDYNTLLIDYISSSMWSV